MCKQLFCLRPSSESFRDKKLRIFLEKGMRIVRQGEKFTAHRILENLLNLLFDTIEFSNNNFKRFFPGFSSCENAVSFIAIDARKKPNQLSRQQISISDLLLLQ